MAQEISRFPADGIEYAFVGGSNAAEVDLLEAVLNPIDTQRPWVYSLAHLAEACGLYDGDAVAPRATRVAQLRRLFAQSNLKKLMFWSQAGFDSLQNYGGIDPATLAGKAAIVRPAVRRVPDDVVQYRDGDLQLLFAGDFFRKGGVHVIDAFERARRRYPGISLVVCCDEHLDFKTTDEALRHEYLDKLRTLPGIVNMGRVPRERLMREVYPATDIFLIPTYVETFGMAILEAMAFGIPVISTNHFAIPEMIDDGVSGLLIDTTAFNCARLFAGYTVTSIPPDFRAYMTEAVFERMSRLIESRELRRSLGRNAVATARTKYSFDRRNAAITDIYRRALAD